MGVTNAYQASAVKSGHLKSGQLEGRVDGRIILRWILGIWDVKIREGWNRLRIVSNGMFYRQKVS